MRKESKKGKCMHSLSVFVYPCLSETVCAHTFCMELHCFDMLSCPDLRLKQQVVRAGVAAPTYIVFISCLSNGLMLRKWLARLILFGTTLNEEGFKERKLNAQFGCVCVPMPEWNCVCSYFLYVVALFWHVIVPWLATETATSSRRRDSPTSYLTQNTCF